MNIIEQFNQIRQDKKYSYRKLSMMTGLSIGTLYNVATDRHNPKKETGEKIELFVLRQKEKKL